MPIRSIVPLPTSLPTGPARTVATAALLLVTAAAVALAGTAGTATAAVPGRCTADVHVRAEPEPTAEVVGLCAAGTAVEVGERRNGFVELPGLGGWSAARYVAVDGDAGTAVTEPTQHVVEDGVTRTTTDESQIGGPDGGDGIDSADGFAEGALGGPRFQRWQPTLR
ncbi:SH3 domain-containing protein [Pseudonocardia lacus]|jgi:uncharacterized protein YraI|uniref:SH3 domain-containing protein n=1 Tax=Pseudonocardia lacus TaxID=2835865 RepID=UPI001BDCF879|nr:SH3 domain-containing protein [Pseudonocardia lacus]